jgi:hypothetical protein
MQRLLLAVRVFFKILFGQVFATQVRGLLTGSAVGADVEATAPVPAATLPPPQARRSEAVTLLASLQREARFVDLVQEPLADYSDEQIGAAARDVLHRCAEVLGRMFDLRPVVAEPENAQVETPAHLGAGRFRLTGNVTGQPPFRGRLVHHGWEAAKCELPQWSGDADAARVVAPAEVELS